MKKVLTDPRLSKSKSPSSSGNRWYTGDDEVDTIPSMWHGGGVGHSHHTTTNELSPPLLYHDDASSHYGSGLLPSGDVPDVEASFSDEPDGRGTAVDRQRTKVARERLQAKIARIMDQIRVEQASKEENVNEYLRLSAMDDSNVDRQQAHRVKAAFEKKNQKSTQTIAQLQRKLEIYSGRLRELEETGVLYPGGNRQAHRQARTVLKDVGQGIRSMVNKPKEFAHLLRDKFGSADQINMLDSHSESHDLKTDSSKNGRKESGTLPSDFKYHSEENVSVAVSESSPPVSIGAQVGLRFTPVASQPQLQYHQHHLQPRPADDHRAVTDDHNTTLSILKQLEQGREMQVELQEVIADLQSQIEESQAFFRQAFDEERLRSEHLEEQLNDMMELHQHEVTNIKQELSSLEEKMEYQLEERTRDMQDMLESCQTKITKMELQQQQQQLISMEGFDGSTVRVLVSRLINVVLALLAVILVFVHTGIHLLGPFLNTRLRCICVAVVVAAGAIMWQNRQFLSTYTGFVLNPPPAGT